eukprot:5776788-Pyramimonas_sp.AAC.1
MDPGLQKSLARVSSQRLARTTSAFIRANPGLYGANHGLRFNDQSVRSKLSASWLSFSESQHVSVVADGITSGSPATDNLVIAAYDPEKRRSTWLPPVDHNWLEPKTDEGFEPRGRGGNGEEDGERRKAATGG